MLDLFASFAGASMTPSDVPAFGDLFMVRFRPLTFVFAFSALVAAVPASAQWQTDGAPVCVASGNQTKPAAVADGEGGAYVVWEDARGADPQVYAQHLNALGAPQWGANGILVSSGYYPQYGPVAVGGGRDGVIIAWILSLVPGAYEGRGQRLDGGGVAHWTAGGIPILPGAAFPTKLTIVSDDKTPDILGPAGAILAWTDVRSGVETDLYMGAVSSSGAQRWTAAVCTATGNQGDLCMVTDGSSNFHGQPRGAIVAWRDYRAGVSDPDIYAQRINYAGVAQWGADGVGIATGNSSVLEPTLVPAGAQNAIVCWPGPAQGRTYGLYADRVGSAGSWGAPIPLTTPNSWQAEPAAMSDLAGGIIAVWSQLAESLTRDLYAQRLDATGTAQWGTTGKLVCVSASSEGSPVIVPGRSGASAIAWLDSRDDVNGDIYAQLLDANGARQWSPAGVPVCRASGLQTELSACVDTTGGAIVAWTDYRNGNADIYAQRVTGWGGVTGVEPGLVTGLSLSAPSPNPSYTGFALAFDLPVASDVSAAVFDAAGRRVRALLDAEARPAGRNMIVWDGRGDGGLAVASGVYWVAVRAAGEQGSRRTVILR